MSEGKKEHGLNFAMENFLKSLPPEMRDSEALKESLRTSESFKAFASGKASLSNPDVAAWAKEPSSAEQHKNFKSSEGNNTASSDLELALQHKGNGNNYFKKVNRNVITYFKF